ncbi:NmrA family NAD(P)-binding protein [Mucilaginibacter lacusdianchii]|uniref:NmrA family NAD(P)-binding protein n=1 Tax=Mucilaginibacter lacusdianchii TaxID=2684211 RepID=UPI00131C9878|nr:NmrA family NAD(P)-binding protein [Mucilaginibacter sp. JXJ CY 39]
MKSTILVAGATGNLGEKICRDLLGRGANVRAIVRAESEPAKVKALQDLDVSVVEANFADASQLQSACSGVSCVVSALAGLDDVIITAQSQLLNAAVQAGVPRFIPSDFCTDYTQLSEGDNRNFDFRKKFKTVIDDSAIKATSIFNGAFSYVLQYGIPLFNFKDHTIAYYEGKADWKIDFTTLDDTAAFTAAAALDDESPRYLRVASFQVSPHDLATLSQQLYGEPFQLVNGGTMEQFSAYNQKMRAENQEGETELYPKWQQAQYLYSMFAAHHSSLDNSRYPDIRWSSAKEALQQK